MRASSPTSRFVEAARKDEAILLKALGRKPAARETEQDIAFRVFEKAKSKQQATENEEAERLFGRVMRLAKRSGELYCEAHFEKAVAISRQRQHMRAAKEFSDTALACPMPSLRIRSLFAQPSPSKQQIDAPKLFRFSSK